MRIMAIVAWMTFALGAQASGQEANWVIRPTGVQASLRGLTVAAHSATHEPVLWTSGAKGSILLSIDSGESWKMVGPGQYSELEFRALHAWDERRAIVASAGTPAIVLKTEDSGKSWQEVHRDPRPQAFFDGLRFLDDRRGVLFGDPIDGRFVVLITRDLGQSWQSVSPSVLPLTREGEAAFAASNSAMIVGAPQGIWIGTGGAQAEQSRVLLSKDFGKSWQVADCPMRSDSSSGIFSLAFSADQRTLVAVGGNYQPDARSTTTAAVSVDGGQSFTAAKHPPASFRSAVVYIGDRFLATGPTGTDVSSDGQIWTKLTETGFHALAVLPGGDVAAVGSDGRFGWLQR